MTWNVENTDEFTKWWDELTDAQQEDITATAELLMEHGPNLPFPHSSGIENSRHGHMRELRCKAAATRSGFSTHSTRDAPRSC
jgi:hypothetical protein